MYLLDTNHCSRLLQGHPAIINKLQELGEAPIATCVIVRGELIFMAHKSERKAENLHQVYQLLNEILVYSIDDKTADIYGKLKATILDRFGPKDKAQRRKAETTKLGFSENDLWIAAVAKRYGLTIVSSDSDFERLKEVEELSLEKWWSPELDN
jgi:tRNA(fMet)-specific endonuclease VapC